MRLLLIGLLTFVLSGCWAGLNLYAPSDARPAIPPGVYRAIVEDAPERVYRVSVLANGLTQFDGGEKKEIYGFAPLDPDHGTFVGWMNLDDEPATTGGKKDPDQIYALLVRQTDGGFVIYAPECKDVGSEIARKSGATIDTGVSSVCVFPTRASLEAAMRLLSRDEKAALRLVRIRS
jgi:hypothetical protein